MPSTRLRLINRWSRVPAASEHRRNHLIRWSLVFGAMLIIASLSLARTSFIKTASASGCPNGATLNVVAHQDDDLLFLGPDLQHAITAGRCVRTIFMTAGDDGLDSSYWSGREAGSQAAYAEMAGVSDSWTQSDAGISGHPMPLFTLTAKPTISLIFMRLPDGNNDGSGFQLYHFESLQKLWTGTISTIHAVDGSTSYTKQDLTNTLTALMSSFAPDQIHAQDYVGSYGQGDHSDHYTAAYFAQAAQQNTVSQHVFTGYEDYNTSTLPANVTGADLTAKENAYFAYAPFDSHVCQTLSECSSTGYDGWLQRQYTVGSENGGGPTANPGPDETVPTGSTVQLDGSGSTDPAGNQLTYQWTQISGPTVTLSSNTVAKPTFTAPASNASLTLQLVVSDGQYSSSPTTITITVLNSSDLARFATATASSQNVSTGQTANKANDGVVDGYPGDYTKEWATLGGGAGSWLKLTWSSPQSIDRVVLYDRPNSGDQVTGGTLQFSDGSSINTGALNNDGSAVTIIFLSKTVTWLQFNITAVSSSTQNVGLAEIEAYNDPGGGNQPPKANTGPNQTVEINSTVQLDGTGSVDPEGNQLTYQWTQTAGPSVTLSNSTSAQPSFTVPSSPTSLTFQLVVNDGQLSSSPATITITAIDSSDLARFATATASSQNTSTFQTTDKANDGVVDGYPGDYTKEWATAGGGAGSWLKLTWSSPQTVNTIVLFDRPNLSDQITGGTIQFSDGSSITVGPLNNDGSGVTITFANKTITSLQLNITSVSSTTQNVGLAEIEVYEN